jgi:alpha-glucoside transport system substrate-binding protein
MKKLFLMSAAAAALALGSAHAADLKFTPGEGDFNWESYEALKDTQLDGEEVTVFGPWLGPDQENVEAVLAYFAEATGADVKYVGSDSFEQQIVIDAEAGSAPNIAVFPQPGLAADMASRGFLTPLPEGTAEWVRENYAAGQSWVDLGTYAGPDGNDNLYGFFYKVDVKSLVWYIPENFEDAGYEIPETMEELKALTEQIVADGETPWCIGLGSGGATGWPATDWVEDMMLRTQPPDVYDKWVSNEIKFTDPAVIGAIEEFGWFARNDQFVAGGSGNVATTDFRDSPQGPLRIAAAVLHAPPGLLHPGLLPRRHRGGRGCGLLLLPGLCREGPRQPGSRWRHPLGDHRQPRRDHGLIKFLRSPIAHEVWMAQKRLPDPHYGVNPTPSRRSDVQEEGEILLNATTFRFDASDLMPGGVGAGTFWTGMVDYTGGKPAEEVASEIQKSWDALK